MSVCHPLPSFYDILYSIFETARFDKMSRYFACKLDYLVGCWQIWGVKFGPVAARNCSIWSLECRLVVDKFSGDKDPLGRACLVHLVSRAQSMYACAPASVEPNNPRGLVRQCRHQFASFRKTTDCAFALSSRRDPHGSRGFLRPCPTLLPGVARDVFTLPPLDTRSSMI